MPRSRSSPAGRSFTSPSARARFAAPPAGGEDDLVRAARAAVDEGLADVPTPIRDAHGELEQAMQARMQSRASVAQSVDDYTGSEGVIQAVAIGLGDENSAVDPGEPALSVFVAEQTAHDDVRAMVVDAFGVRTAGDVPLVVRTSGLFDAQPHRFHIRAAPGGVSVGHPSVTAGTLGCFATGRTAPRDNRLLLLSNNHVLADSNNAALGDAILQPGVADGGTDPDDQIATLERFQPIAFGGAPNVVDCATGWCWPDRVRTELFRIISGNQTFFRMGAQPVAPFLGMVVGKTGRTTQVRQGSITDLGWAGQINYGTPQAPRLAFFTGQIAIRPVSAGEFSRGGDSGSAIWAWDVNRAPVGLLFAGSMRQTIANPMPLVLDALDIDLFT
jgi:hypothetical protein